MPDEPGGEKTLPASGRKRQRAREQGNVVKSQDLSGACMLLAALLALRFLGPYAMTSMVETVRRYVGEADRIAVRPDTMQELTLGAFAEVAKATVPFMGLLMVLGVAVNAMQVGFLVAPEAMSPKFGRLNPLAGFGRYFTMRSFVELVKALLKLTFAVWVVYAAVDDRWWELITLMQMSPIGIVSTLGALVFDVWWRLAFVMLLLGLFDYGYQRWQYEKDLMMTQREAREEAKEMEGDPRIKQRIRQIQRQMAMQRMMKQVPKAEVVVTNPTHYAVALQYDPREMGAPVVTAKGMNLIAQRIRQTAVEHDVPVVERPELARSLYKSIDIGAAVPEDLFRAVAEVLAYVYRIDRRPEKVRERASSAPMRRTG